MEETPNNLGIIDDGVNFEMISRVKDKEFDAIEILVDLAKNVMTATCEFEYPETSAVAAHPGL